MKVKGSNKQPSLEQLEICYRVIAIAILDKSHIAYTEYEIEQEAFRIERVIDFHYKNQEHNLHYGEFAKKFIQKNYRAMIEKTDFHGKYIEDVPDISVSDMINNSLNECEVEYSLHTEYE